MTVFTLAVVAPVQSVLASPWDDRSFSKRNPRISESYFDDRRLYTLSYFNRSLNNYVMSSGLYVYNVNDMMNYLISKNRGPSGTLSQKRDVAGAAFIVHTILGRNGAEANANGGRAVSDADFNSLRSRLNAATISWNTTVCTGGVNTMAGTIGGNGPVDILRDPDKIGTNQCELGVSIRDGQGNVYNIFHRCANPVGDFKGIIDINFDLIPTITGSPDFSSGSSAGADSATLRPTVNNRGTTQSTGNIQWKLVRFVLVPGLPVPRADTNTSIPETYFGNGAARIDGMTGQRYPRNVTLLNVPPQPIGDLPIGTRICYALSVQPITQSNSSWRHSTPFCITIAKSPKAQVRGGDIRVGSSVAGQPIAAPATILTSQTRKSISGVTRTFGSWGEYAVTATGLISGIGSGSAFAGPGLESATTCSYTFLTLANAANGNCASDPASSYGQFRTGRSLPDVATRYPAASSAGVISGLVDPAGLSGTYSVSGDIRIGAGVIAKGRSVIINTYDSVARVYRNVILEGNITYTTDTLADGGEIPQLIIIANNIGIQPGVTQVDAWLIARRTLNTCSGVPLASITASTCNAPLTVNGPVMANQLQLWRTAGSNAGAQSGDPAEIFNLRPDAYLWGLSQSAKSGRLQTVYEQELPPRF